MGLYIKISVVSLFAAHQTKAKVVPNIDKGNNQLNILINNL